MRVRTGLRLGMFVWPYFGATQTERRARAALLWICGLGLAFLAVTS